MLAEMHEQAIAKNSTLAAQLAASTGYRAADLPDTFWLLYAVVRELRSRAGGFPGDNRRTTYMGFGDDVAFNGRVKRYVVGRAAANYVRANAPLTGRLRDPVVILNNTYNDVVSVSTQSNYPTLVRRAGQDKRLTVLSSAGEGHCRFNAEQMGRAFDTLRRRVEAPPSSR